MQINRIELLNATRIAVRCIEKSPHDILSSFLLTVSNGELTVTASHLDTSIRALLPVSHKVDYSACINAKSFSSLLGSIDDGDISFDLSKTDEVRVIHEKGSARFKAADPKHYPNVPFGDGTFKYKFKREELLEALHLSGFVLENDSGISDFRSFASLKVFTNLIESKFEIQATDGSKAVLSFVNGLCWKVEGQEDGSLCIPKKTATHLMNILSSADSDEVYLSEDDSHIFLTIGSVDYSFRKANIVFPDMEAAKTHEFPIAFRIDAEELNKGIRRLQALYDDNLRRCRFLATEDELTISAEGPSGYIEESFPIQLEGEAFDTAYSVPYLINALSRAKGEIELRFVESSGSYAMKIVAGSPEVQAQLYVQGLRFVAAQKMAA